MSRTHSIVKTSLISLTLLAIMSLSTQAFAGAPIRQGGNFGLGVGTSYGLTGLSLKYFMSDSQAVQGTAGVGFGGNYIGATLDYLLEIPEFVQSDVLNIGPSIGLGGALGLSDSSIALGINGVAGLEFMLNPIPIDFVVEWRPGLRIIPNPDLALLGFAAHVRYYF